MSFLKNILAARGKGIHPAIVKENFDKSTDIGKKRINDVLNATSIEPDTKSVCIIGAGFGGLMCGWTLSKLGFSITIIEATDTIGGRVQTMRNKKNKRLIETGAEFIGLVHTLWIYLSKYFDLGLNLVTPEEFYTCQGCYLPININGKNLSPDEVNELEAELTTILQRISHDANQITKPETPWLECPEIKEWDKISLKDKLDEWKVTGNVREIIDCEFSNNQVQEVSDQSYLGLLCQVKARPDFDASLFWQMVENFRCSSGNHSLAESLGKDLNIHKNSPVINITNHADYVDVNTKHCRYRADYVVLTIPPTMWEKIVFSPEIDLVEYMPYMGPALKWIVEVEKRFWINANLSPNGFSTQVGIFWEATENQQVFSKDDQAIYLSGFSGGPTTKITKNKELFIKGTNALYLDEYKPHALECILCDYTTTPHIATGYANGKVGQITTISKNLYYPLNEFGGKLLFAGEHTQVNFMGYMEGALQSGYRVALNIYNSITLKKDITPEEIEIEDECVKLRQ
ncbi:MAG: hypothetical protein Hyperionvirus35_18 [Hyperionvirus sp.]|uniref:Amine oxidase domain-containing protein n=1 Tax=Hyperionvirus sp. TaxID=2487770 RepID=A0A3G5AC57_9VIRU|nr:MAG: hypothetical protein Hyperionvirus35_18 [Hyperionvirus sp.]